MHSVVRPHAPPVAVAVMPVPHAVDVGADHVSVHPDPAEEILLVGEVVAQAAHLKVSRLRPISVCAHNAAQTAHGGVETLD